jgi:hypothetical protein
MKSLVSFRDRYPGTLVGRSGQEPGCVATATHTTNHAALAGRRRLKSTKTMAEQSHCAHHCRTDGNPTPLRPETFREMEKCPAKEKHQPPKQKHAPRQPRLRQGPPRSRHGRGSNAGQTGGSYTRGIRSQNPTPLPSQGWLRAIRSVSSRHPKPVSHFHLDRLVRLKD